MTPDFGRIVAGVTLFVAVATVPITYNLFAARPPAAVKATGTCVLPLEQIRADHPVLLAAWRDEAVRSGQRTQTLEACLDCHGDAAEFCDRCHARQGVEIGCFDCHRGGAR